MIFFTVNPIIFGEVWTAKKHVICWNITTYKNMDVKLLHPVWKDFLDTVNTVVLTGYWKQLIIFLFDIQCFFQSGSECRPWTKIIGNSCLVIQKIHLDFLRFFYLQCKEMVEYILVCSHKSRNRIYNDITVKFYFNHRLQSSKQRTLEFSLTSIRWLNLWVLTFWRGRGAYL